MEVPTDIEYGGHRAGLERWDIPNFVIGVTEVHEGLAAGKRERS